MLIDRQEALDAACADIRPGEIASIDTEFMRTDTYAPVLCLAQVATARQVYCIDELAGLDTTALWQRLATGPGLRLLHAAKQDMEVLWLRHRLLPAPLFDTQIAAALVGHPAQMGYAALVKALLDIEIDKTHTRADWSRRPLAPALLDYAANDVVHLPALHALLEERLEALGRLAWAMEDSARLVDGALYEPAADKAWERLTAIAHLPVPAQLRARRLATLREAEAIRADRPRQWIFSDKSLLDIAMRAPQDLDALAHCEDLPAGVLRRRGAAILQAVAEADADPATGSGLAQRGRPDPEARKAVAHLARVVEGRASALGIAPELLATRKDLAALVRGERDLRPLEGWRREEVGRALLEALPDGQ